MRENMNSVILAWAMGKGKRLLGMTLEPAAPEMKNEE
jgi:hypothetical protein